MKGQHMFTTGKLPAVFGVVPSQAETTKLIRAEEDKKIPHSVRIKKGTSEKAIEIRHWYTKDLPSFAKMYGYLKKPEKQIVLSVYSAKGGIMKTTLAYNIARMAAMNNIKTIIIGLDMQKSITGLSGLEFIESEEEQNFEDIQNENFGLFEFFNDKMPLNKIIKKTDMPTLDIIPENTNLLRLVKLLGIEHGIKQQNRFTKVLLPELTQYDLVIFDNPPNINYLVENSIECCSFLISPLGLDAESFRSIQAARGLIEDLAEDLGKDIKKIYVPTGLRRTVISKKIENEFRKIFGSKVVEASIRDSTDGEKASLKYLSAVEWAGGTPLADDYLVVVKDLWKRITE